MISTVTVSTVSTIMSLIGLEEILGLVAVIALIAFLCVKELAGVSNGGTHRFLARSLDISIVPLIIAFGMIVAMEIVAVLA